MLNSGCRQANLATGVSFCLVVPPAVQNRDVELAK